MHYRDTQWGSLNGQITHQSISGGPQGKEGAQVARHAKKKRGDPGGGDGKEVLQKGMRGSEPTNGRGT